MADLKEQIGLIALADTGWALITCDTCGITEKNHVWALIRAWANTVPIPGPTHYTQNDDTFLGDLKLEVYILDLAGFAATQYRQLSLYKSPLMKDFIDEVQQAIFVVEASVLEHRCVVCIFIWGCATCV